MSDDEDIASGTFAEFCDAIRKGQFENVTNRTELWKLLATIAVRKTRDCHKYENAMRRGGGIERYSFDELRDQNGRGKRFAQNFDVPCPVVERNWDISIADLQKSIADEGLSEVLRLKVQGLENREIARQIGCSLRTIQYMVRELTVTVLAWGQAEQLH